MSHNAVDGPDRRACVAAGGLALLGAGLDLISAVADPKADPSLSPKTAVIDKLNALNPNHAVLLGKADVVGEFDATAHRHVYPVRGGRVDPRLTQVALLAESGDGLAGPVPQRDQPGQCFSRSGSRLAITAPLARRMPPTYRAAQGVCSPDSYEEARSLLERTQSSRAGTDEMER